MGKLYVVPTPVGNLEDMTFRAIRILKEADLVLAEDTRTSGILLKHFEIKNAMQSHHKFNEHKTVESVVNRIKGGETVALISDAGTPGISDPGEHIAQTCIAEGIPVVPVPGANAALTALVASGLSSTPFFFGGFLPKSRKNRREKLAEWKDIPATIILYEAPHRIIEVLSDIEDAWGDRTMTMARELTKLHEEFFRGTVSTCRAHLLEQAPRGEFVLVIAGGTKVEEAPTGDPLDAVRRLMADGVGKKEALQQIAKVYKLPKRELYNRLVKEGVEDE